MTLASLIQGYLLNKPGLSEVPLKNRTNQMQPVCGGQLQKHSFKTESVAPQPATEKSR